MPIFVKTVHRACAALVVGCVRHRPAGATRTLNPSCTPFIGFYRNPPRATCSGWRLMSSFQAPEPPRSKCEAVFPDIHFSATTSPASASRNTDPGAVFVVTGASRGIGLEFVKALHNHTKGTIVACCRTPSSAVGLSSFVETLSPSERQRIFVIPLDLEDQISIEAAGNEIRSKFQRVDLLLNVAGLLGDGKSTPGPERSLGKIDREWLVKSMNVNVIGPVMVSQQLSSLMAQKKHGRRNGEDARANAVIVNLSARVGSISDNSLGGWYSYRITKAALNQATRTMALELKRQSIWCIALHPGTTDTDLSKPFQKNVADGRLFPVEFTVSSLLKVIDSMDDEHSGGLFDWAGKAIPF